MSTVEKINSPDNGAMPNILSHATKIPGLVFISGQVPTNKEGKIVEGGIEEHTEQCLNNIGNVLKASGTSWDKVVKVNIYLKDMSDFGAMNKVYEKLVPTPKPARTCIQAGKLPLDVDIEIEAVAAV